MTRVFIPLLAALILVTTPNISEAKTRTSSQDNRTFSASTKLKLCKKLVKAVEIAKSRARASSTNRCWRYVKVALLRAEAVESYPGTVYAKQAGNELRQNHGFRRIAVNCPYKAPVGAVLVYGGKGAGHVELRTATGFVSDFASARPSQRPLIGVYVKIT